MLLDQKGAVFFQTKRAICSIRSGEDVGLYQAKMAICSILSDLIGPSSVQAKWSCLWIAIL